MPPSKSPSWRDQVGADPCLTQGLVGSSEMNLCLLTLNDHNVKRQLTPVQLPALVSTHNTVLQETVWHMLAQSITGCGPPRGPPSPLSGQPSWSQFHRNYAHHETHWPSGGRNPAAAWSQCAHHCFMDKRALWCGPPRTTSSQNQMGTIWVFIHIE